MTELLSNKSDNLTGSMVLFTLLKKLNILLESSLVNKCLNEPEG